MRIHHLNCGLMSPLGGALFDGVSPGLTARLTCHCLLIETGAGLVLVDTGFGLRDVADPHGRLDPLFLYLDNIQLDERRTAYRQIEAMGFSPRDVRDIVMTHLDFDHAGGLHDFPWARIHVSEAELNAAERQDGPRARRRYPLGQLDGIRTWTTYRSRGEGWFGFKAVQDLDGLPPEILLVALPGHTEGHAGVAVAQGEGFLLHAADTYFHRHEMDRPVRECPLATRGYQRLMAVDHDLHLHNQARLRELYHRGSRLAVFCTHDPVEFEALAALSREGANRSAAAPSRAGIRADVAAL